MSRHRAPTAFALLLLAGKMASAARTVVGGESPFGRARPATVANLTERCNELRAALDEYDAAVVKAGPMP